MKAKLLIAAIMLSMSISLSAQSGTCGDNLTWTLSGGTLTISGTGAMTDYTYSNRYSKPNTPWYSYRKSIKTIIIEDGVTSIGDYAFFLCTSLTSITIPNSVTSIGERAFDNCTKLTSVTIPNSVTSIGDYAFLGCSKLTSITILNSVTSIGDYAFRDCSSLTSITIPNSVTSIGSGAFWDCTSLTSITMGNSVTSIGGGAFYGCNGLTSVTIPNSVTSIGNGAFAGCDKLTSVIVESGNSTYDSRNNCNAIIETATNTLIAGCQATTIPNSVTSIGNYAFEVCSSLTSITIPNSVTSIGNLAFFGCRSLTSITIPNSVTSIGEWAFNGCSKLTSVTCEALTPLELAYNGAGVFDGVDKSIPLYVPAQSIDLYKAAYQWKNFTNILPITSSIPATFTITFLNYDGSELQSSSVETGTIPQYNGETPTKPADDQYTYTFASWLPDITAVTADATYTATFTETVNTYVVTFMDGTTVLGTQTLEYGQAATAPEVETDNCRTLAWDKDFSYITGDLTVTAVWTGTMMPAYSVASSDETRGTVTVTQEPTCEDMTLAFRADAAENYEFVQWSDGNTDNPRVVTLNGDLELTAQFEPVTPQLPVVDAAIISQDCSQNGINATIGKQSSINGHEYVDLGLPSGNLWATCNMEAETYEEYGGLFAWGEISSREASSFSPSTYLYADNPIPLNNISGTQYDAATANWGGGWKIPTYNDIKELMNNTSYSTITINGKSFHEFTASNGNKLLEIIPSQYGGGFWSGNSHGSTTAYRGWEFGPGGYISYGYKWEFYPIRPIHGAIATPENITLTLYAEGCETPNVYICNAGQEVTVTAVPESGNQFKQWSDGNTDNPRTITMTQNLTLTAVFVKKTFLVSFLNYDGTELQSSELEAGTMPQYSGITPTKPADAQYTYTFAGWDKEVVAVTGDATYTAVFVSVVQCGTIETTDGITVWEDQLPYTWEGISFTTAGTETKTLQASDGCDSIVTFTLHVLYRNITLQENETADYYTQFAEDYNGRTVNTATLNRQFTQGRWATLCLPFNVNKALMTALGLYNRVFELRYAEKEDDSAFSIFFAPAQSIEAGKGYIVNPNAKLAAKTSFVFPNVTINTDSDNGDITALTGYNDGTERGNLFLVGTLRTGILQGTTTGNTWLGLKDNQLYYPNTTSGTSIHAYRGFFRSDIPVNASRLRIIADGETVSELQVVGTAPSDWSDKSDPSYTPARKYLRNGLLFIERNGITYTAQGHRLD